MGSCRLRGYLCVSGSWHHAGKCHSSVQASPLFSSSRSLRHELFMRDPISVEPKGTVYLLLAGF